MRRLLCKNCEPALKAYEREPGWAKRIGYGKVKAFTPDQVKAKLTQHSCDDCNAPIVPGDQAITLSMWLNGEHPHPAWELNFLEVNSSTLSTEKGTYGIDFAAREES